MALSTLVDMSDAIPLLDLDTDPSSPSYNQYAAGRNTAREFRVHLLGSLFAAGSGGPRPGVLGKYLASGGGITYFKELRGTAQGSPSRIITYPAGALIAVRSGQGAYHATLEADTNITMPAADGSLPRIDVVYAMAYDKGAFGADALHGPKIMCETGTPNASPAVPSIPADAVKLSEVYRRAGATGDQIAQADITDKRRGTAMHGDARPLLGGDSLADNGSYHGDMRLRSGTAFVNAGLPLTELIDRWSSIDSKWHGTQSMSFDVRGVDGTITTGNTRICAQCVIPDPGWAYKITAGGEARLSYASGGAAAALVVMQYRTGFTTMAATHLGDLCAEGASPAGGDSNLYFPCAPGTASTTFTGSQTVSKLIQNNVGKTLTYNGGTEVYERFMVTIDPA